IHHPQCFAKNGMPHFIDRVDVFDIGVLEPDTGAERTVDGDVDVAIDGSGDQKAAELFVIRRQIGPTAAEADAQRTARDDHRARSAANHSNVCFNPSDNAFRSGRVASLRRRLPSSTLRSCSPSLGGACTARVPTPAIDASESYNSLIVV